MIISITGNISRTAVMAYASNRAECDYVYLTEGIHLLTLHTGSETAVAQCFTHLHDVFRQAPPDRTLRLLSDLEERDMPPIFDLWKLSRNLLAAYPKRPPTRNAILYSDDTSRSPFHFVVNLLAEFFGAKVRLFTREERDAAVRWLLEA